MNSVYKDKANPHSYTQAVNRRAKKHGAKGRLTYSAWLDLLREAGYRCKECGRKEPEVKLTPDHIVPLSKGGRGDKANIQILCEPCNQAKADK
jgi:5-methylcytosine-specific restriction endonuclease McrA